MLNKCICPDINVLHSRGDRCYHCGNGVFSARPMASLNVELPTLQNVSGISNSFINHSACGTIVSNAE